MCPRGMRGELVVCRGKMSEQMWLFYVSVLVSEEPLMEGSCHPGDACSR